MGNLYILMGDRNTRKSSTARALTGFTKLNPLDVRLANGSIRKVFVIVSSGQEQKEEKFHKKINRIRREGHEWDILLALWPDDAIGFIQEVPDVNRQEIHIVPLGVRDIIEIAPDLRQQLSGLGQLSIYLGIPYPDLERIPPTNEIASQVRGRFSWL